MVAAAETNVEEELIGLFDQLVDSMPVGKASVHIKRPPQIQREGVSISMIPANPAAAQIVADAAPGWPIISLVLGRSTFVEVLPERNMTRIEQVREMCDAVIQGRFEEDLTLVGSEVVKCVGTIEIQGKRRVFRYFGKYFLFKKKQKQHLAYSPY